MRTAIAAAATALLLSTVSADWDSWSESPTDDPSVSTTDVDPTWSAWDSASTTTTPVDPSTWSEWDPAASTSTTSSSTSEDPETWSEWESSTSSKPVTKTSSTSDPGQAWSQWTSSSVSSPAVSSKTTDPGHTWSAWDPTETVTSTSTQWATVTVYPVNGGQSWSAWASVPASSKTTVTSTAVVSSTVTKTATGVKDTTSSSASSQDWSAWSAPAAPVAVVDPMCKMQVSISYGAPVWYPTPVIATSVNSTAAWGEWDPASSTPVASTSTSSARVWSEWASTTSSTPAAKTSTTTDPGQTWSQWVPATSSTPAVKTTTDPASSWSAWSAPSQTQGGAFYTASAGSSGSTSGSNSGSWSQGSTGISANGNKFGMTYSPYTAAGGCKDQSTVSADIAKLAAKGFTSVRVYSTDCSTLEFVGNAAKQNGIKVILGVFISDTGISGAQPQVDAIAKWAQWDLVELIVVGNEAVFSGRCSASDLAGFIGSAKKTFQGAGFKGAISTTDELSVWQGQGSAWCDVVDVVSANLYAFFNADTAAEDAGDFIQRQIQDLSKVCPGKEVYVMESGWPSAGECNGKACPSPENQATAIKGIQQTSGAKVVFFSFEDEQWKQPGQYGVEQHWGCGSVF